MTDDTPLPRKLCDCTPDTGCKGAKPAPPSTQYRSGATVQILAVY